MNDPIRNQHSNNILHQLETKDEDIVLGEQSVIVSKKKKTSSRPNCWDKGFYFHTEFYVANVQ